MRGKEGGREEGSTGRWAGRAGARRWLPPRHKEGKTTPTPTLTETKNTYLSILHQWYILHAFTFFPFWTRAVVLIFCRAFSPAAAKKQEVV